MSAQSGNDERLLTAERRSRILDRLRADGKVLAAELSAVLGVSPDTIRRDLTELADAGLLQRVHGGALPPSPGERPYAVRRRRAPEAKDEIARTAALLTRDDQVILLDAGTTTLAVARHLPPGLRATVVTPGLPIALALAQHPGVEVEVIGGTLRKDGLASGGVTALEALRRVRADLCFLGVCSLHPEIGVSVPDADEAPLKRAMVEGAAEVVAVADAGKLGTVSAFAVCRLDELTHLVTERAVGEAPLAPYRERGLRVVRA